MAKMATDVEFISRLSSTAETAFRCADCGFYLKYCEIFRDIPPLGPECRDCCKKEYIYAHNAQTFAHLRLDLGPKEASFSTQLEAVQRVKDQLNIKDQCVGDGEGFRYVSDHLFWQEEGKPCFECGAILSVKEGNPRGKCFERRSPSWAARFPCMSFVVHTQFLESWQCFECGATSSDYIPVTTDKTEIYPAHWYPAHW